MFAALPPGSWSTTPALRGITHGAAAAVVVAPASGFNITHLEELSCVYVQIFKLSVSLYPEIYYSLSLISFLIVFPKKPNTVFLLLLLWLTHVLRFIRGESEHFELRNTQNISSFFLFRIYILDNTLAFVLSH